LDKIILLLIGQGSRLLLPTGYANLQMLFSLEGENKDSALAARSPILKSIHLEFREISL